MPMTTAPEQLSGRTLMGSDGDKIGKIADVYLDDETGNPEWLAVTTGLFGSRVSFVPLAQASSAGDDVTAPYSKEQVKDAPNAEADGRLSQEEEAPSTVTTASTTARAAPTRVCPRAAATPATTPHAPTPTRP